VNTYQRPNDGGPPLDFRNGRSRRGSVVVYSQRKGSER
jgi:hypothetical protein